MRNDFKNERLSEKEKRNLDILNTVRRSQDISRADISRLTGLNIVTVSNYINTYVKRGLVHEVGLDVSTGGRRPELIRLNPDYGYLIGVDLGAPHILEDTVITAVSMNIGLKQTAKESIKKEEESQDKFMSKVMDLIATLMKKTGLPKEKFLGIGLGIWGVLDRNNGTVRYTPEEGKIMSYVDFQEKIERKFKLPTIVEHDAMAAALGEKWAGIGLEPGVENILFVCSDSSVGIIIKDELYYGASKSAGELNLNPPNGSAQETPERKCWESYNYGCCLRSRGIDLGISSYARNLFKEKKDLKSIIMDLAGDDINKITFSTVVEAANQRDKIAINILEEAGAYLGAKIAYLINLFNPEAVVIGRGVERGGRVFFDALKKSVNRWAFEESLKVAKIIPTTLGEDAVAAGAAALILQKIFAKIG